MKFDCLFLCLKYQESKFKLVETITNKTFKLYMFYDLEMYTRQ